MNNNYFKIKIIQLTVIILLHSNLSGQTDNYKVEGISPNVLKNVEMATVKITNETKKNSGSGVIIGTVDGERALILTACHVVSSNYEIYITDKRIPLKFYNNISVKIVSMVDPVKATFFRENKGPLYVDPANDIAVVATTNKVDNIDQIISYRENMEIGEISAVSGFPHGSQIHQEKVNIKAVKGNNFIFSANVSEEAGVSGGNSGGPLVDKEGRMVGMVVKMNKRRKIGEALKMNLVSTTVNNWLEKQSWIKRFWEKDDELSFWEKLTTKPVYIGTAALVLGGAIGSFFLPSTTEEGPSEEPDLPGPPDPGH